MLDEKKIKLFIEKLTLPKEVKDKLNKINPISYTGLASLLASRIEEDD